MNDRVKGAGASLGVGVVLVLLGTLFLLEQFFDIRLGQWMWPLFIIIPGLLCFVGMILGGKQAGPLAIPGSIVSTIGLLLLYQNTFNHFESWAYAWALIPIAVGIGMTIYGTWSDRPAEVQNGRRVIGVGMGLFLFGFFFFEVMLNISGAATGLLGPLLLVAAGLYLLVRRFLPTSHAAAISAPTVTDSSEPVPPVAASEVVAPVAASEPAPAADDGHAEELLALSKGEPVDIHGIV